MEKLSIIQKIKQFIAGIGWRLFIWGNDTCEEKYWDEIYEQERAIREDPYELDM